jgi:hypothetical protein
MAGLQSRLNLFGRAHPRDMRQYFSTENLWKSASTLVTESSATITA